MSEFIQKTILYLLVSISLFLYKKRNKERFFIKKSITNLEKPFLMYQYAPLAFIFRSSVVLHKIFIAFRVIRDEDERYLCFKFVYFFFLCILRPGISE
jgi:hypothetical protein